MQRRSGICLKYNTETALMQMWRFDTHMMRRRSPPTPSHRGPLITEEGELQSKEMTEMGYERRSRGTDGVAVRAFEVLGSNPKVCSLPLWPSLSKMPDPTYLPLNVRDLKRNPG